MASSLTDVFAHPGNKIRRLDITWTSHTDGTVANILTKPVNGVIIGVTFNHPQAAPPDTLYDATLLDPVGRDALNGLGANVVVSGSSPVVYGLNDLNGGISIIGFLTLSITGAGSGKIGIISLDYIPDPAPR